MAFHNETFIFNRLIMKYGNSHANNNTLIFNIFLFSLQLKLYYNINKIIAANIRHLLIVRHLFYKVYYHLPVENIFLNKIAVIRFICFVSGLDGFVRSASIIIVEKSIIIVPLKKKFIKLL